MRKFLTAILASTITGFIIQPVFACIGCSRLDMLETQAGNTNYIRITTGSLQVPLAAANITSMTVDGVSLYGSTIEAATGKFTDLNFSSATGKNGTMVVRDVVRIDFKDGTSQNSASAGGGSGFTMGASVVFSSNIAAGQVYGRNVAVGTIGSSQTLVLSSTQNFTAGQGFSSVTINGSQPITLNQGRILLGGNASTQSVSLALADSAAFGIDMPDLPGNYSQGGTGSGCGYPATGNQYVRWVPIDELGNAGPPSQEFVAAGVIGQVDLFTITATPGAASYRGYRSSTHVSGQQDTYMVRQLTDLPNTKYETCSEFSGGIPPESSSVIRFSTSGSYIAVGKFGLGTMIPSSIQDINGGSLTIRGAGAGLRVGSTNFVVTPGNGIGIGISTPTYAMHIFTGTVSVNHAIINSSISLRGIAYNPPPTDGTAGQLLGTSGTGQLGWYTDQTGGGGGGGTTGNSSTPTITLPMPGDVGYATSPFVAVNGAFLAFTRSSATLVGWNAFCTLPSTVGITGFQLVRSTNGVNYGPVTFETQVPTFTSISKPYSMYQTTTVPFNFGDQVAVIVSTSNPTGAKSQNCGVNLDIGYPLFSTP